MMSNDDLTKSRINERLSKSMIRLSRRSPEEMAAILGKPSKKIRREK